MCCFCWRRRDDYSSIDRLEVGTAAEANAVDEKKSILGIKNRHLASPYLHSSVIFAISSLVSFIMSVISCKTDGFTTPNVGALVANGLYVIAYALYVRAEWKTPQTSVSALPLMNSAPMIQHM